METCQNHQLHMQNINLPKVLRHYHKRVPPPPPALRPDKGRAVRESPKPYGWWVGGRGPTTTTPSRISMGADVLVKIFPRHLWCRRNFSLAQVLWLVRLTPSHLLGGDSDPPPHHAFPYSLAERIKGLLASGRNFFAFFDTFFCRNRKWHFRPIWGGNKCQKLVTWTTLLKGGGVSPTPSELGGGVRPPHLHSSNPGRYLLARRMRSRPTSLRTLS